MKKELTYMDSVHRDGRIWSLSIVALMLLYPLALCLIFGAVPDGKGLLLLLVVGLVHTGITYCMYFLR